MNSFLLKIHLRQQLLYALNYKFCIFVLRYPQELLMKNTLILIFILISSNVMFAQEARLMLPIGQVSAINSAKFSPNGRRIVIASDDATVKIWDIQTGSVVHSLEGHSGPISTAIYSPDGKMILSSGKVDKMAKIWSATTGKLIHTLGEETKNINYATFSSDGQIIITACDDNTAKIWDAQTGKILQELKGHIDAVNFATFSSNSKLIITTSDDNTAKIWSVQSGNLLHNLVGHKESVVLANFSPDNSKVVTVSKDSIAKIWDLTTGELLKSLEKKNTTNLRKVNNSLISKKLNFTIFKAIFSPDGQTIATIFNDNIVNVWDANKGNILVSIFGNNKANTEEVINSMEFSPDGKMILTSSNETIAKLWHSKTGQLALALDKFKDDVTASSFSSDGKQIITTSYDNTAKIWDVIEGSLIQKLEGHTKIVDYAKFSPDGKQIITVNDDNSFRIWDVTSGQIIVSRSADKSLDYIKSIDYSEDSKRIKITHDFTEKESLIRILSTETGKELKSLQIQKSNFLNFSPDLSKYLSPSTDSSVSINDIFSKTILQKLKGKSGKGYYFGKISPNEKMVMAVSNIDNSINIWETQTGKLLSSFQGVMGTVKDAHFLAESNVVLSVTKDDILKVWDVTNGKVLFSYSGIKSKIDIACFSPDGQKVITNSEDDTLRVFDVKTSSQPQKFSLPFGALYSNVNFKNKQFSLINNSEVKLYNLDTRKELLTFISIDSTDWAVIHPSGLFDASPNAMEKMYWVKGDELIALDQLKVRYWQPNLWSMVVEGKPLRSVEGINSLKLQPEIELNEVKNDTLLIKLKKREGGFGEVSIAINNKEVLEDARPKNFDNTQLYQTISINLKTNPALKDHLVDGLKNNITVKAKTTDGFLSSRGEEVIALGDEPLAKLRKPAFYAVICGTSEFRNTKMNLKYPVIDAKAIAKAVALGAGNLFGKDSTHVFLLSSRGNDTTTTTKQNIQKVFERIKAKAKPEDIVMVYLSGHGVTYGGEKGDFYYLTTEYNGMSAESFSDPKLRKSQSISTEEFTDWLNAIPALKQIMIIDACGSGKAVDNLIARRDIESSQIKAIDRMKDRTGLYVLSGCAANAVSYEANRFGQGLLTYSVLQAMRGMALRENKFIDISTLLNYSSEEVPKMAKDIGGIQKPQMLIPKGGSFDIGIIRESDKSLIPLSAIKPVFVRTTIIEETKKRDILKIAKQVDEKLNEVSGKGDESNTIIFIDVAEYPESCSISGSYTLVGEMLSFLGSILCGTNEKPIKIENVTKEKLIEQIVAEALKK